MCLNKKDNNIEEKKDNLINKNDSYLSENEYFQGIHSLSEIIINLNEILDFIISCVIVVFSNVINLIIFYRCEEFKALEERFITPIFNKIKSKIKKESN